MSSAAPNGSIASLPSPRPDLLAFEIRKKIPEADIEWMSAVVDQAFDACGEIDMLLIMTNFDGSELGAIFDGDAMKVQTRSLAHVRRYVVVGAPAWATAMINVFGTVLPVESKTFGIDQVENAWRWVSAPPNP